MRIRRTIDAITSANPILLGISAFALTLVTATLAMFIATHITADRYTSNQPTGGPTHGVVVGWRGHAPGPLQCFGVETTHNVRYVTLWAPFWNVDC